MKNSTRVSKWEAVQKHSNFLNFLKATKAQLCMQLLTGLRRLMTLLYTSHNSHPGTPTCSRLLSKFPVQMTTSIFWEQFSNTCARVNLLRCKDYSKAMGSRRSIFGLLDRRRTLTTLTTFSGLMLNLWSRQTSNGNKTLTRSTVEPQILMLQVSTQVEIDPIYFSSRHVLNILTKT